MMDGFGNMMGFWYVDIGVVNGLMNNMYWLVYIDVYVLDDSDISSLDVNIWFNPFSQVNDFFFMVEVSVDIATELHCHMNNIFNVSDSFHFLKEASDFCLKSGHVVDSVN